ncbi:DHCW motif cupin fold protein [Streptomyces bobili]|uniref:DHCW motif cupin fold protein n=1 Tax=Streptomyces bobili TaxID=67280 RepID=UPI00382E711C
MEFSDIIFETTKWSSIEESRASGEVGEVTSRIRDYGSVRVRMVEYSPGYVADHWCRRGHVLLVLEGSLTTELESGETVTLEAGESYQVGNDVMAHRSRTVGGARLFVVD